MNNFLFDSITVFDEKNAIEINSNKNKIVLQKQSQNEN